jgi:hypothetical protein
LPRSPQAALPHLRFPPRMSVLLLPFNLGRDVEPVRLHLRDPKGPSLPRRLQWDSKSTRVSRGLTLAPLQTPRLWRTGAPALGRGWLFLASSLPLLILDLNSASGSTQPRPRRDSRVKIGVRGGEREAGLLPPADRFRGGMRGAVHPVVLKRPRPLCGRLGAASP